MSFQEKSLWVMFASLIATFGVYFGTVLPSHPVDVQPQEIVWFAVAVAVLVMMAIAGHVVIAIVDRRAETDERDRVIGLQGTRNASYVLATGVSFALFAAIATRGNFVFTHVLLGFWVLAQLVEIGSQLVLYRRGA